PQAQTGHRSFAVVPDPEIEAARDDLVQGQSGRRNGNIAHRFRVPHCYTRVKALSRAQETDMRVVVDYTLCESNAVCMRLVPEVFEVRDDDRLYLRTERPPEALRARVDEAVRRCLKQALSLVED